MRLQMIFPIAPDRNHSDVVWSIVFTEYVSCGWKIVDMGKMPKVSEDMDSVAMVVCCEISVSDKCFYPRSSQLTAEWTSSGWRDTSVVFPDVSDRLAKPVEASVVAYPVINNVPGYIVALLAKIAI